MTVVIAIITIISCSHGHFHVHTHVHTHLHTHCHTQTNTNIKNNNSPSRWRPHSLLPGRLHQSFSDAPIAASNFSDLSPPDDVFVGPSRHSFPSSDTVLPLSTARRLRRASGRVPLQCLPGKGTRRLHCCVLLRRRVPASG